MSIIAEEQWKLSKKQRLINRYNWLLKQSKQRLWSLEQKGVRYDADYTEQFKKESEEFAKEARDIKKLITKLEKEEAK